ncbi:glycosyltransferase family 4 protein [Clostridium perfringens]|nr:glycosyltransferase family 4 protein [Clostridium perfringens]
MGIRVAHICTSKISYKILEYKLKCISDLGYDISIISSNDCEVDESFFDENKISKYFVDMNRKINLRDDIVSILKLKRIIEREKFDIIHTHTAKAGIIGRIAAKLARVPIIIHTSHGLPYFEGMDAKKYFLYKNIERLGAFISDYIGSQNKEDLNNLKKLTREKKIYYEGNGVDLDYLDNESEKITNEDIEFIKSKLDIDKNKKVILMAARFESVKNHKLFVDAIEKLAKLQNNFICLLAGDGPLEQEIKEYIKKKKVEGFFKFIGKRDDIYLFIKLSDVVVLTSLKEGIPRILMESMAFRKAIVATNVLGTKELICDKKSGLLSELEDIEGLALNVKNIINNKTLANKLANESRKRIEQNFTEKIVAKRIDVIYKLALKEKGIYK